MQKLSFEELMDIFESAKISKDFEEIKQINLEFERRIKKRKLMKKKPMRTSLSGYEQTQDWLKRNSHLKKLEHQVYSEDKKNDKTSKNRNKNLREDTDINKKNFLW